MSEREFDQKVENWAARLENRIEQQPPVPLYYKGDFHSC